MEVLRVQSEDHEAPKGALARELFRTRAGFVLAAAGSAVGLGNMWRFPYQTAEEADDSSRSAFVAE